MARRKQDIELPRRAPQFVPFQFARLVKRPPSGPKWLHEIKFDGYRMQTRVEGGRASFHTRNGLDWTDQFPALAAAASNLPDALLDGELCALGPNGYPNFSALRSALARRQTDDLVFYVFDLLFDCGDDLRSYALTVRKKRLRATLDAADDAARSAFRWVDQFGDADPSALIAAACEIGLEGIVSKRTDGLYKAGKGDTWLKTKCRPAQEVVIGGWRSEGRRFRSLIAGVWDDDGRLRYAGRIHTGYSDADLRELPALLEPLEIDRHAFEVGEVPKKTRDIHWARPELVAEIEFAEFTASGKLRQAAFKGLRPDKSVEDLKSDPGP